MKPKSTDCRYVRPTTKGFEYGVQRYLDPGKAKLKYGRNKQPEIYEFIIRGTALTLEEALFKNGMLSVTNK